MTTIQSSCQTIRFRTRKLLVCWLPTLSNAVARAPEATGGRCATRHVWYRMPIEELTTEIETMIAKEAQAVRAHTPGRKKGGEAPSISCYWCFILTPVSRTSLSI